MMRMISTAVLAFSCIASACAESSFSWHGFLAQGLAQSSDSNFIDDDGHVSTDLTEVGLNMRYNWNSNVAVVGQGVYLNGGNRFKEGGKVDYLFIDFTLPRFDDWSTNIHVGRFKSPHWLYSATRDVPQTRATTILPQSVYFDNFRDVSLGSDGVLVQLKRPAMTGLWEINWSYGKVPISQYQTKSLLGDFAQGELEQKYVHQFSVFWQPPSMNWKLGASWLDSEFDYNAADDEFLVDGGRKVDFYTLSAVYFAENWELSTELVRSTHKDSGGYYADYYTSQMGEGGYVQWRYFLNQEFTALLGYDHYISDRHDRSGHQLEEQSGGLIPAYFGFQKTATVGLQWNFHSNWRLQAEHHWVHGAGRLTSIPTPTTQAQTMENWRMWAVELMYWF